jgi:hypothetical protein
MKRQLIPRNKARQDLALCTYGTPTKPFLFRIYGQRPETSVHTRRFCKRKQKRYKSNKEPIHEFPRDEIAQFPFQQ